jgi:UPF0755 protein
MMRWLLGLSLIAGLGLVGWTVRDLFRPYQGYSGSVIVNLDPGTRAPQAARLLFSRGVLAHELPFLTFHALARLDRLRIKAGEYMFDRPLRPIDVYRKLARGDIYLHAVVIPEGSDRFDMARILNQQMGIDSAMFLQLAADPTPIRDLDPKAPSLDGYLFPDTYRFPRGVSAERVVETMLARFRHVIASRFRSDFSQSPVALHDAITLASLVEKETPQASERPLIAGVFVRRLERGWNLQCDPTVVYAARLGSKSGAVDPVDTPITESELQLDSPYNTYRKPGLPPGPICSPGEASIRAALTPAKGKELYFVSNANGGHVFATTLSDHQRNVKTYRKEVAAARSKATDSEVAESAARRQASATTQAAKRKKSTAHRQQQKHGRQNQVTKHEGASPRGLANARS